MKLIIAGGRDYTNELRITDLVYDGITILQEEHGMGEVIEVVCGMAPGVDAIGRKIAISQDIPVKEFPAQWLKYGKSAGPKRNLQMAEYADALIAIWDGQSRGTASMIKQAKELGLKIVVFHYIKKDLK